MGFCEYFMKWLLHIFNVLAAIVSILLIILGSVILNGLGNLKSFNSIEHVETIPVIVLALGAVIFIVSLLAWCGAMKNIRWCMIVYAICMFILSALQIALVVWGFMDKNQFLNGVKSIVYNAFQNRNTEADNQMNLIQTIFSCCGYNSSLDYVNTSVPSSCCGFTLTTDPCPSSIYTYKEGCEKAFYSFWGDNLEYVRFGGIAVAGIEFLAFILACGVAAWSRNSINKNMTVIASYG